MIAVVLMACLLLVHYSVRAQPISARYPLDVDRGLPLPEVGQASTVFSLTALFGAYLGIYLMLGVPALAGLACGTVLGLFAIRSWVHKHRSRTFEEFISSMLSGPGRNGEVFAVMVLLAQCAYAASELLILRETSRLALGMRADYAMLFAVSTGIIGYFYVLFGGYMAVYRTDIAQFVLVASMALAFGVYLTLTSSPLALSAGLWPRTGYWDLTLFGPVNGLGRYVYHFAIGAIMGFGLFGAAPDAWKRVFVVTRLRRNTLARFAIFAGVGIAPFLALIPFGYVLRHVPNGTISLQHALPNSPAHDALFIAASLGLIACFLSSFNSALLASVHIGLLTQRSRQRVDVELPRFHWLMAIMFSIIFCIFIILCAFDNPYLLGNLLLGLYAIIAGIQAGTAASPGKLPENSILWISVVGFVLWFLCFVSAVGLPTVPTTYEVNTVPFGALLFIAVALICRLLPKAAEHHA